MTVKAIHITIIIIRNQFRLLKNWLLFKENKIMLFFLIILLFFIVAAFSVYFGEQSSINAQIGSIIFTLIFPIFIAGKYLIFTKKEDSLLLVLFDKKDLFASKQLLVSFFSLSIFSLMLLCGIVPHLWNIPFVLIIMTEILLLLMFSWLIPFVSLKINFQSDISKSTRFWDNQISNINLLPVRGIILREFLSLWRENKKSIIRSIINLSLFNIAVMFFIINNGKIDFFVWAMLLQVFICLTVVINYPTLNNVNLMKSVSCKEFNILKGEFVFWLTLFLTYLTVIVLIYSLILSQISIFPIVITILLFAVFLFYVLLIRLAYADNEFTRALIFVVMFIPITIPYYIYNSYRRLKC